MLKTQLNATSPLSSVARTSSYRPFSQKNVGIVRTLLPTSLIAMRKDWSWLLNRKTTTTFRKWQKSRMRLPLTAKLAHKQSTTDILRCNNMAQRQSLCRAKKCYCYWLLFNRQQIILDMRWQTLLVRDNATHSFAHHWGREGATHGTDEFAVTMNPYLSPRP